MSLHYKITDSEIQFIGHSYPHREAIKALGGRFDGLRKAWVVAKIGADLQAIDAFCKKLGGALIADQSENVDSTPTVQNPPPSFQTLSDLPKSQSKLQSQGEEKTYRLSEICDRASLTISKEFSNPVWIEAEIESFTVRPAGIYLTLAEPKHQTSNDASFGSRSSRAQASSQASLSLKATMWRSVMQGLKAKYPKDFDQVIAENTRVRFLVQVQLYRDRGQLTLNIIDFDLRFTQGELALMRAKIVAELRRLGIFEKNKAHRLTAWPETIGLITAKDSRAESDFLHQLEQFGFRGRVIVAYASMQGEKTAREVIGALEDFEGIPLNAIVITRGGGSTADLRWFDDFELASKVANYKAPVIAAIGHHEDTCVTEMVAFSREKTPTGAADYLINWQTQSDLKLLNLAQSLEDKTRWIVDQFARHLLGLERRLRDYATLRCQNAQETLSRHVLKIFSAATERLNGLERKLSQFASQLFEGSQKTISTAEAQVVMLEKAVLQKDPQPWMAKGWTQLWESGPQPKNILFGEQLQRGQLLKARLLDSLVELEVRDIIASTHTKGKKYDESYGK